MNKPDLTQDRELVECATDEVAAALYVALASNPKLMEVLLNYEADHARVKAIRYWAGIFQEAAC